MNEALDIYGIEGHELEPVDDTFEGVKYYRQDDVQEVLIELLKELVGQDVTLEIKL